MKFAVKNEFAQSEIEKKLSTVQKCAFKSVRSAGAIIRKELPNESKEAADLNIIRQKLKSWTPNNCPMQNM